MTLKTIANFWKLRLNSIKREDSALVKGWTYEANGFLNFVEAPLRQNDLLNNGASADSAEIILVSAPGAVGKSTLAREIAASTGAVYIDLAKAEPVGGNTLIGGLAKSQLYASWQEGRTAVLIDGLDEARLRVTQEAFASFFSDIAELSRQRGLPTVLFGRTGSIEDAWLMLSGHDVTVSVLEIGYYSQSTAVEFAEVRLRGLRSSETHKEIDKRAIELLLNRLRGLTEQSGSHDKFAGYAPVLQAVADRVFAEANPSALVAVIEAGEQPITLQTVADQILQRERGKLSTIQFTDSTLTDRLYQPSEQLDRLVALVYDLSPPSVDISNPHDAQIYASALETWVAEHPFLKGNKEASSVVFEAVIINHALRNPLTSSIVVDQQLLRGIAANPFLSEFYIGDNADDNFYIPADHIGIIYSSMRARLALGDKASLIIDGSEESVDAVLTAEVEIAIAERAEERAKVIRFSTDQERLLRLGCYLEDVSISAPNSSIEIGPGAEAVLIAPIDIQCAKLIINASRLTVESAPGRIDGAVFLETENVQGAQLAAMPLVRGEANLRAAWPGARSFPWTSFAAPATPTTDPRMTEALRRFRKFVIAFRSHSKGDLRRVAAKLDHARMTKGLGAPVLQLLKSENIITSHGPMYELNPDALGAKTGATYRQCMTQDFSPKTIDFLKRAL